METNTHVVDGAPSQRLKDVFAGRVPCRSCNHALAVVPHDLHEDSYNLGLADAEWAL